MDESEAVVEVSEVNSKINFQEIDRSRSNEK